MTPKLALRNVLKSFGGNQGGGGVDLSVGTGQMVCLTGASGPGKSTRLRRMSPLEPIDDGAIHLDEQDVSEPGLDAKPVKRFFNPPTFLPT